MFHEPHLGINIFHTLYFTTPVVIIDSSLICSMYDKCIIEILPEYLCTLLTKHNIPYDLRDDNRLTQKMFQTITYGK